MSGFLGYATAVSALESGYRVRGVVRKETQIDEIKRTLPRQFLDNIEFVIVPDLRADGAFNDAMKDVDHMIHMASPVGMAVSLGTTLGNY